MFPVPIILAFSFPVRPGPLRMLDVVDLGTVGVGSERSSERSSEPKRLVFSFFLFRSLDLSIAFGGDF